MKKLFLLSVIALGLASTPASAVTIMNSHLHITQEDVEKAQEKWGDALVGISAAFNEGGIESATEKAENAIDTLYGYDIGGVLFKPTLTQAPQTFRNTREGALAYFVGNNPNFANDNGFAILGWTSVKFDNSGMFLNGNTAKVMGNVTLTNADGSETTVDKTMVFKKIGEENLKIVLHHSSLPYSAE
ncbi:MAG: phosphoribosyl-AMP cyclohydrolase [Alphaproteobacteria bacterium]